MFLRWFDAYINSFKGFSREVWILAAITLINRAGTMVIPFLSLYLTNEQGFSKGEIGWVMTFFGLGSVIGSWIGGKLTDIIGAYKVMVLSLLGAALLFIGLQYLSGPWAMRIGVLVLMSVADMFRPAMFVALRSYSKPENRTRSVTLIRLAINLGFSAGPAIGGLIIATIGYGGLFWIDGLTCMLAGLIMIQTLKPKKNASAVNEQPTKQRSPYTDSLYLTFLVALALFSMVFMQLFSTIPVFYSEKGGLMEDQIGILMAINGLLIFVFEMPFIKYLDKPGVDKVFYIALGAFLMAGSYLMMIISASYWMLVGSVLLVTLGEMLAFPFANAFAMDRAKHGKQGAYMALFTIAFSIAHIFAHNAGFHSIDAFGYPITWWGAIGLTMLCVLLLFAVIAGNKRIPTEQQENQHG